MKLMWISVAALMWAGINREISQMPQVKTIGDAAFYNCNALTTVTMPQVKTIGQEASIIALPSRR